ncbi:DUF397 domain-containing protein [Streptomyces sp. NBC_01136]|uniref:DUF397 domain-containing protein n=1 Tax=unclassified Streptomyces TaxID=2593676 RepID=UPI003250002A|nr:DUF397 domain-containing protein [Streptomyces sp. NBC_01136]
MLQHTSWQRSSYCGSGDSCVHVTATATATRIHLTESSDPRGAILTAAPAAFRTLLLTLKEEPRG